MQVDSLLGDCTKLREATGWAPSVSFLDLVKRMVRSELKAAGAPLPPEA